MKLLWVLLFVCLASVKADIGDEGSEVGVRCSAFAALKIRTVGTAKCKGQAGADCAAVASSQSEFREAYAEWFNDEGTCDGAKLEVAAEAIATACAAVYAKTFSKVTCEGEGAFACGYAISDGAGFANALARASAQAVVDASTEKADAFCYSDVSAVAGALANAAASARSAACVKGTGSEEDFQEAFVESVSQAYANAFASAVAKSCSETGAAAASSLCSGEAEGKTVGEVRQEATEKAKAAGEAKETPLCCKDMDKCCAPGFGKRICEVESKECGGMWVMRHVDGVNVWQSREEYGDCLCLKQKIVAT